MRAIWKRLDARSVTSASSAAAPLGVENWHRIPIGITMAGGRKLHGSTEVIRVDTWAHRTGRPPVARSPPSFPLPGLCSSPRTGATSSTPHAMSVNRTAAGSGRSISGWIALEQPTRWWNAVTYLLRGRRPVSSRQLPSRGRAQRFGDSSVIDLPRLSMRGGDLYGDRHGVPSTGRSRP
jgi:hypothetical protein